MSVSKDKRNYWYAKLDEVLHLWYQNAGQGYYNLVMNELCVLARKKTRTRLGLKCQTSAFLLTNAKILYLVFST